MEASADAEGHTRLQILLGYSLFRLAAIFSCWSAKHSKKSRQKRKRGSGGGCVLV